MSDIVTTTTKANSQTANHTGAMIAYFLPSELANHLAIDSSLVSPDVEVTQPSDMHITVMYLGDTVDSPELVNNKAAIVKLLADFTANYEDSIHCRIGGIGRFLKTENDGADQAFYASVDSLALHLFKQKLEQALEKKLGVTSPSTFAYTPHITLAYLPIETPIPPIKLEPMGFLVGEISLAWGDERMSFPIGKPDTVISNKEAGYSATAGQTITGNLARGGNGQFASGGSAGGQASNDPDAEINDAKARLRQALHRRKNAAKAGSNVAKQQAKVNQENEKTKKVESGAKAKRDNLGKLTASVLGDNDLAELFTVGDDPFNLVDVKPEYGDRLVRLGLATKDGDLYELNSNGTAFIRAAQKGDAQGAKLAKKKGELLAKRGQSKEADKKAKLVAQANAKAKKLAEAKPKTKTKTATKEFDGTTFKHLPGQHVQAKHGRPGIGAAIRKVMKKDGLDRVEARRKVASAIMDNPKATDSQLRAVKRIFPAAQTPKRVSPQRLEQARKRVGEIETEFAKIKAKQKKLPKKDIHGHAALNKQWGDLFDEQNKLNDEIKRGELYQERVGKLKSPAKPEKTKSLKRKLADAKAKKPKVASDLPEEYYQASVARDVDDLIDVKKNDRASYDKQVDDYRNELASAKPGSIEEREIKTLLRELQEPEVKPKQNPKARITKAFGSDPNKIYEFEHEIVDLDDLITSNTDSGAINPAYSQELQPRLRDRQASKLQIQNIAKNFVSEGSLLDFHDLGKGPAIIGDDNMVESGNGRTMAMQLMAREYPEKWQEYQNKLRENLASAGLSEADLAGKKNPVLIRRRKSEVDRTEFAREANRPPVLQMSALEQAKLDQHLISDSSLEQLDISDDQTIDQALRSSKNRAFIQAFTGQLSVAERAPLMRGDGTLSQQGLWRAKAAIFTKLFPGEAGTRLADTFLESLDSNIKNFESGISASMPKLARAESLIANGRRNANLSISEDLSMAIDMLARLKEHGPPVEKYLSQVSMFEAQITPFQKTLLKHFNSIGNKPKAIKEFMLGYAAAVEEQPDPAQGSLFEVEYPMSKETIVNLLIQQHQFNTSGQAAMFKQADDNPVLKHIEGMFKQSKQIPPLKRKNRIPEPDSLAAALNWDKVSPNEVIMVASPDNNDGMFGLTVVKEAKTGKSRWILRTSTAFKDRDGQIVSTKALKEAVDYMDTTKEYGPLRWYHVGNTSGGLDLGDCDFSMLSESGRTLIESGTFRNEKIATAIKQMDLEVSPGFRHALTEPDKDGVFHQIRIFERSLLPRGTASNLYTGVHLVSN